MDPLGKQKICHAVGEKNLLPKGQQLQAFMAPCKVIGSTSS
jgi:hypothetical protein